MSDVTKRLLDIGVAVVLLIVVSPILLGLAVAVKLGSDGPVFYIGTRAGRYGRPFRMLKFRSMVINADRLGGPSTSGDDPRLTSVGRFMRRYKFDEFPQLMNVLIGDMSLVGPRPEVMSEVAEYTGEYREILDVRPGITDWASIWNSNEEAILAGSKDPHAAYKRLIQPTKLRLQLFYCRTRSLWTDAKILAFTAIKIVNPSWYPRELEWCSPASNSHESKG